MQLVTLLLTHIHTYTHTSPPYALRHNSLHRILSHRFTAAIYEAIATMDVLGFPVALAIARLLVRPSHLAIVETDVLAVRRRFPVALALARLLARPSHLALVETDDHSVASSAP